MSTSKNKQRLSKERKAAAVIAAQEAAERRRRRMIGGAIALTVVVIAVIVGVVLLSKDNGSSSVSAGDTTTTASTGFTYGTAPCAPTGGPPDPPQLTFPDTDGFEKCVDTASVYTATFSTTAGTVVVQLDAATQPGTVNNFVQLARFGYYDGSQLFRTDPSLGIIQGGAPHTNSADDAGPGFTIEDEGDGFTYKPGQLVMARTQQPDSAGSQFFFTVTDASSSLDAQGTYVVFGTVISGMDILEQILASNVEGTSGLGGSPAPPVTVTSVVLGQASLTNSSSTTVNPSTSTPVPSSTAPSSSSSSTVDPSVSTPQSTSSTSIPA